MTFVHWTVSLSSCENDSRTSPQPMDRWQWTLPAIHEIPCPSRNRAAASFSQLHTSATPPHQSLCAANTYREQTRICTQLLCNWMTTRLEIFYLEMATNLKIPSWPEEYRSLRCIQKQQAESTSSLRAAGQRPSHQQILWTFTIQRGKPQGRPLPT